MPSVHITVACPVCNRWTSIAYLKKACRSIFERLYMGIRVVTGLGYGRGFKNDFRPVQGMEILERGVLVELIHRLEECLKVLKEELCRRRGVEELETVSQLQESLASTATVISASETIASRSVLPKPAVTLRSTSRPALSTFRSTSEIA